MQTCIRRLPRPLLAILVAFATSLALLPAHPFAATGDTGTSGIWNWQGLADGTLSITGCTDPVGDLTIPATLDVGGGQHASVTGIGCLAFAGSTGLTGVTIPSGMTSIGDGAFQVCTGLASVTIPGSVSTIGSYAFNGCKVLTSVTIPSGVTGIADGLFYDCAGLTSVTIPDGVTSIGYTAFFGCSGLTGVTIPNGTTSLAAAAFQACTGLTGVTIPRSVTSIGDWAFYGCTGLTSVTVLNSAAEFRNEVFVSSGMPVDGVLYGFTSSTTDAYAAQESFDFVPVFKVSFDSGDGSSVDWDHALHGGTVPKPGDPTKDGNSFEGWYPTEALDTLPVDFPYTVTEDVVLYAKWVPTATSPSPEATPTQGTTPEATPTEATNPETGDSTSFWLLGGIALGLVALAGTILRRPSMRKE